MTTDPQGLSALKPCPFCGGTELSHFPGQVIACININCGGQVDMGLPWGGPKEDGIAFLIAAWNTRSEGPQPPAVKVDEGVREEVARLILGPKSSFNAGTALAWNLREWTHYPHVAAALTKTDQILSLLGFRHEG